MGTFRAPRPGILVYYLTIPPHMVQDDSYERLVPDNHDWSSLEWQVPRRNLMDGEVDQRAIISEADLMRIMETRVINPESAARQFASFDEGSTYTQAPTQEEADGDADATPNEDITVPVPAKRILNAAAGRRLHKNVALSMSLEFHHRFMICLLYTSPSPRDRQKSRMPSSA